MHRPSSSCTKIFSWPSSWYIILVLNTCHTVQFTTMDTSPLLYNFSERTFDALWHFLVTQSTRYMKGFNYYRNWQKCARSQKFGKHMKKSGLKLMMYKGSHMSNFHLTTRVKNHPQTEIYADWPFSRQYQVHAVALAGQHFLPQPYWLDHFPWPNMV